MKKFFRRFVKGQVALCKRFDARVFGLMSVDGNSAYIGLIEGAVGRGSSVVDIGGGKTPLFSAEQVAERKLEVTGVDIDAHELGRAPHGAYRSVVVGPIEKVRGNGDQDIVVAQSVLEHVQDGRLAALGIGSFLRPGGRVYTFCPSRRAWFARLNLLLPENVKRKVLFSIFPEKAERQGFPANYNGCTPTEMVENMRDAGVECKELRLYFASSYFMFFFPLYLFWRIATYPLMKMFPKRYCETFIFIGEKV